MAQAERFYDDSAFSQEIRLVSNDNNFIDWTVGLFYTNQDYNLGQNSYLKGYDEYLFAAWGGYEVLTEQDFIFRRNQQFEETAVFGEATINFRDDLHLTLGGRYFENELDVDAFVHVPIWGGEPGVAAKSIDESDTLFKANLGWDVTEDSMVYATVSEGYRHGGANAVPTSGKYAENPEFFTFDSDKVVNYEVGYKGVVGNHSYSASLYYTDWKDPQLNTITSNWGFFAAVNGESAKTQGIELELSGAISESLSYSLGYTYADSQLTGDVYKPACNSVYGGPASCEVKLADDGDRLPGTSEHVFNVALGYNVSLSSDMDWNTQLSGYYQSNSLNSLGS